MKLNRFGDQGLTRRRDFLRAGATVAIVASVPSLLWAREDGESGATAAQNLADASDLYVFSSPNRQSTVLATTWPAAERVSRVVIHAGARSWTADVGAAYSIPREWQVGSDHLFSGGSALRTFVVEIPVLQSLATLEGVWVERLGTKGYRKRAGSPLVASILRESPHAAAVYHATTPASDLTLLSDSFRRSVSSGLAARRLPVEADRYARKLIRDALPDVVKFDYRLPTGFTFAGRNGRHPGDASAAVATSLIHGGELAVPSETRPRLAATFPYLAAT